MIETIQINGQSYNVDEEVAEQFSKFINRAKRDKARIKELELLNLSLADGEHKNGLILDAIRKCFPNLGCTEGFQLVSNADYNNLVKVINGE